MPNLVNPHTGELQYVPDEDLQHLHGGWREETSQEEFDRYLDANRREEYGGGADAAWALVEGALSGASLGLWDVVDSGYGARQRAEYNSGYRAVGELAGGLAPAFLTGGTSEAASAGEGVGILGRLLSASPAAWVGKGGRGLQEVLGGGRLAQVAAAAAEGSAFGVGGAFSHAQMSDDPLTAEAIFHGAGLGALTGGGLSLGFQGLGELGRGMAKLRDGTEKALTSESPALTNFTHTWEEMRDNHATYEGPGTEAPQTHGYQAGEAGGVVEPPKMQEAPRFPAGSGPETSGVPEEMPEPEAQPSNVPEVVEDNAYPSVHPDGSPVEAQAPWQRGDYADAQPRALNPNDSFILKPREAQPGTQGTRVLPPEMLPGGGGQPAPAGDLTNPGKVGVAREADTLVDRDLDATKPGLAGGTATIEAPGGATARPHVWGSDNEDLPGWLNQPRKVGEPRGLKGRAARELKAGEGARAWEAKLDREAVPEYVGETEQAAAGVDQRLDSGDMMKMWQEGGPHLPSPPTPRKPDLSEVLTSIHGEKVPRFPTTVKGIAGMPPDKAVKLGMTLNAMGEHTADLEGRVQTLLSDLERELGVATPTTETPAQRWMGLRRAAREASGTVKGPRPRLPDVPGMPPADRAKSRGFFARWRRRVLGNVGDSVGRGLGGKGIAGKAGGALLREGGYVVASVLGGPKGLGLALGSKWLLKSRLAEVMMGLSKATPSQVAPLGRTAVWLKDRKGAAQDILRLHAQAQNVGNLVYHTVENGGASSSSLTPGLVQKSVEVTKYLASLAPHPGPGLDSLHWEPSLRAMLPLVQAIEAVVNPVRAFSRVLAGQSGKSAVQALWMTYPEHLAQAVLLATNMGEAELAKMPQAKKQALSMFLQAPMGGVSPYATGAAALRSRLFKTGPEAAAKMQAHVQAQARGGAPGRPAESTKLDQMQAGQKA